MPEDWTSTDRSSGDLSGWQDPSRRNAFPDPNSPWQTAPAPGAVPVTTDSRVPQPPQVLSAPQVSRAAQVIAPVRIATVRRAIWMVIGTLITLDFITAFLSAFALAPYFFLRFFDADQKINFPTGTKTSFLLFNALLMVACWWGSKEKGDPVAKGWILLAAGTGFAFLDETTYLHQSLSTTMADTFGLTGVLKYSWTILYAPAAAVIGVFLLRNLKSMDPDVRRRLLIGGGLFVGGALLLEPIKSKLSESVGDDGLAFRLTAATSDSLELSGLALLTGAMLLALSKITARFSFDLDEGGPSQAQAAPAANFGNQFPAATGAQYGSGDAYPAFNPAFTPASASDATWQAQGQYPAPQPFSDQPYAAPQYQPQASQPLSQHQPLIPGVAQQQQYGATEQFDVSQYDTTEQYDTTGQYQAGGFDPYAQTGEYPAAPGYPSRPAPQNTDAPAPEDPVWPSSPQRRPPNGSSW
ncbi:MAG: hypothetical protein QG622_1090 [Actinomycetota bacterium]|nr:hypothetical protein [Actinomycetota bacterium]